MLARGFSVRATDGSPEMAAIALQRLNHPVEAMLFHELDARAAYDGVWPAPACCTCRVTSSPASWRASIARYKVGHGDGRDSLGRYYNYPPRGVAGCDLRRRGRVDSSQIGHRRDQEL